jgi:hypothetical protein
MRGGGDARRVHLTLAPHEDELSLPAAPLASPLRLYLFLLSYFTFYGIMH